MDANGLLTVVAVLIAGYALLSEEKRIDFKLRLSWWDITIFFVLLLIVLAIVYQPVLRVFGWVFPMPWMYGFNESMASFTALLGIIAFSAVKLSGSKLPVSNVKSWASISDRLLKEKKFDQLGFLFAKYHSVLFVESARTPWLVRIHTWLYPDEASYEKVLIEIVRHSEQSATKSDMPIKDTTPSLKKDLNPAIYLYGLLKKHAPDYVDKKVISVRRRLAKLFPSKNKNAEFALASISRILKSKQFVSYISETYPLVAAKASAIRFPDDEEYINTFFTALISHSESPLYRELRDNQSCSYTGEYYLDESNALLNFYFKDIDVASRLRIYKPVGDYVIEYIEKQRGPSNYYNQPCGRFSQGEDVWSCPIFMGTLFFDLMVSSAIFQRNSDHMWLMYLERFFDGILDNLAHSSDVDINDEFPSRYDFLLYNLLSTCGKWVKAIEHLECKEDVTKNYDEYPEIWAAKTYGSMLRKAVESDKLTDNQKIYFLEMVVRVMKTLDQKSLNYFSQIIFNHCTKEEFRSIEAGYIENLKALYDKVDHVEKNRKSTFEVGMKQIEDSLR